MPVPHRPCHARRPKVSCDKEDPGGREELAVRRRALPLLVPPGTIENLQQRAIKDEQALPATLASERQAPHVTE